MAELPSAGKPVRLAIEARRFHCDAVLCGRRIFAERIDGDVLAPSSRRTARLDRIVHHLGLALGGRPAATSAKRLMLPVSNDTLLRVVRRRDSPRFVPPTVIGIDDRAWRRNQPSALRDGTPFHEWVLPAAMGKVRKRLKRADDGNRQTVTILGCVPGDGLAAVEKHWLWRAVDQDGHVIDEIVQAGRDTKAAKRLLVRLLKKAGPGAQAHRDRQAALLRSGKMGRDTRGRTSIAQGRSGKP